MLILTGCEESELKGSNNSKIIETIDTDESNDIKLSYYEHFIFEFSSGDTCSILFTSATEDQINFKIHVGEPYLIDGEVPTAENCVGTLCGEVVEYPVYCQNAVQYNSGVTKASQLQVGSNQNLIYIQGNEETISVERDARFLIDKDVVTPTAFKLTRIDSTSYNFKDKGILSWMVAECQTEFINDDILNGVAGYLDKNKDILYEVANSSVSQKNQQLIKEWM